MPHFIVEYTANMRGEANIPELLRKANAVLMAQGGVFPTGGIRSRAVELTEYAIADSAADYAFVHASLKIGAGRTAEEKKAVGDALFAMMQQHLAPIFATRYLALSMEFNEFNEAGTWKQNNLHARFKKPAPAIPAVGEGL